MANILTNNLLPEGFETHTQAVKRRAFSILVLLGGNRQQRRIAAKLQRCRKGHRCKLGACNVCERLFRLRLLRLLQPILNSRPRWTRASVVTADLPFAEGELTKVDLNAIKSKITKRLERWSLRSRIVIAGIDISLNTEDNIKLGRQLHLYLIIEGEHTPQLEEAVKATFPPEKTAKVPYHFKQVTGKPGAVTYLYKSVFWRRSRYTVFERWPKNRTRNQSLKRPELREALELLGRYPVSARLILRGLRRNGRHLIVTKRRKPGK